MRINNSLLLLVHIIHPKFRDELVEEIIKVLSPLQYPIEKIPIFSNQSEEYVVLKINPDQDAYVVLRSILHCVGRLDCLVSVIKTMGLGNIGNTLSVSNQLNQRKESTLQDILPPFKKRVVDNRVIQKYFSLIKKESETYSHIIKEYNSQFPPTVKKSWIEVFFSSFWSITSLIFNILID